MVRSMAAWSLPFVCMGCAAAGGDEHKHGSKCTYPWGKEAFLGEDQKEHQGKEEACPDAQTEHPSWGASLAGAACWDSYRVVENAGAHHPSSGPDPSAGRVGRLAQEHSPSRTSWSCTCASRVRGVSRERMAVISVHAGRCTNPVAGRVVEVRVDALGPEKPPPGGKLGVA